jgi:hypothetical protein
MIPQLNHSRHIEGEGLMVGSVGAVSSAAGIQELLVAAVAQILEQSTQAALLNLQIAAGNPDGVGENIDVSA